MSAAHRTAIGLWDHPGMVADAHTFLRYAALAAISGLVVTLVSVAALPGWPGAAVGVGQGMLWCGLMLYRHPGRWLRNIAVAGVVAGFVELAADAWLVDATATLVYPPGPSIARSPAYMPLAWFGMLICGMALGVALRRRWSVAVASAAAALAVGVYIPSYEIFAAQAGWWHYRDCAILPGGVPVYIVVGEVLIALPLVIVTERLIGARTITAAAIGAGLGAWIFASYALAWYATSALGWGAAGHLLR